jgi:hypothetical protein
MHRRAIHVKFFQFFFFFTKTKSKKIGKKFFFSGIFLSLNRQLFDLSNEKNFTHPHYFYHNLKRI